MADSFFAGRKTVPIQAASPARLVRLPSKLLISIGLAVALVIGLAAFSLWQNWASLHREAGGQAESAASLLDRSVDASIGETDLALQVAAEEYRRATLSGQSPSTASYTAYLNTLRERQPNMLYLRAADASGVVRYGDGVDPGKPVNIADREHFKIARASGLAITAPILARIGHQWALPVARRLETADGHFAGIVYALIKIEHFSDLFASMQARPHSAVVLFDADANIMIRQPEPKGPGSALGLKIGSSQFKALWQQGQRTATYRARSTTDGIWRTYSYRQVGNYPFYIMVGLAESDYLTAWKIQAAATAILLVVSGLLLTLLLRSLAQSIKTQQQSYDHLVASQEQLKQSEKRYRGIIEDSTVPYALCDDQQHITFLNAAFTRIFGYSKEDIPTLDDWWPRAYPDPTYRQWAITNWQAHLDAAHQTDTAFEPLELNVSCKDGSVRTVLGSVAPLDTPFMGVYLVTLYDITERRQAEDSLRTSEERLRLAQEAAGQGWFDIDLVTGRITVSSGYIGMMGYDSDEFSSDMNNWLRHIHPEDVDTLTAIINKCIEDGGPYTMEYRRRTKSGEWKWLRSIGKIVQWDAGHRATRMLGIHVDINAQKQVAEALKDSEATLREAQIISALGSYSLDVASGAWTSSEGLDVLFGIDQGYAHTVAGWTALIHPEDRVTMAAYLVDHVLAKRQAFNKEYRIIRQTDQAVRWVHGLGRLEFDADGSPVTMKGTIQDITERVQAEQALLKQSETNKAFLRNASDGIHILDQDSNVIEASDSFCAMLGYSRDEILGLNVAQWDAGLLGDALASKLNALYGNAGRTQFETRHRRKDGSIIDVEISSIPLRIEGRTVLFNSSRDISQRKKAEEQLHLAASVFSHAREGIMITDADATIIDVNDTFTRITGYSRAEIVGQNPRRLNSGRQSRDFYADMWRALNEQGYWNGEIWNRRKDGEVFAEMLTISAVRDDRGVILHFVALFSDISALKEHEQRLEHIAHYDALTGLPNRVLLADRLHQAMAQTHRRGQQLAVAYLDLDGFKSVNDRHGHETGDQLLILLAARMKEALREGDTLARLGGDEFVAVLLDLSDIEASVPMLTRLLNAASEPARIGELVLQVSASVGVTFYPQPDEVDADHLLRQSDQAMYQAKLAGKNRYYIFDPDQDRSVRGHHESIEHIRQALVAHELVLYYQPKVNMRTGQVIGAEALLRWQHPERGLLLPNTFLPIIEDNPLAIELGEWVIDSALSQLDRWHEIGLDLSVSINVGALQLQQHDFVDRLRALLASHPGIRPACIELEVLETSALQDVAQVSKVIEACREIGLHFALDDFGTGYSSLTYLKRLPAHVLKIDQSFVRGMLDDPEDLAIVEGVLGLTSAFRRQAVAEGVESVEHGQMLLQLGCELAQGYGIARPMPAQDLLAWVGNWQPDPRWLNVPALSADDLPLLYASVEHRAWIQAIEAALRGMRKTPPQMDHHHCRFGTWLDQVHQNGRLDRPAFLVLDTMHRQIHALAAEMLELHARNRTDEALARLDELHGIRDRLLGQLQMLIEPHEATMTFPRP
jgi:diguanylate cyclase (GGDEF)-like protein/PAS domain S-box-containing protein